MKVRALTAAAAAALAVTACTPGAEPAPESVVQSCGTDDSLPEKVAVALDEEYEPTGRYGLSRAADEDGWFLALEYTVPQDQSPATGVWFTRGTGQVFSVDEAAISASSWGLGEEDAPSRRRADAGFEFTLQCLAERGEKAPVSDT